MTVTLANLRRISTCASLDHFGNLRKGGGSSVHLRSLGLFVFPGFDRLEQLGVGAKLEPQVEAIYE